MNKKISMIASFANAAAVLSFAVSMIFGNFYTSCLSSTFIAFSFVAMICAYTFYSKQEMKLAGIISIGFAVMYANLISIVYFAQITTIQRGGLSVQATNILDYQKFGLFFNYNMLGYALMALSTFFAGLTINNVRSKGDKWLKALLLIHGIFFIFCFILPMLNLLTPDMGGYELIGTAVLEFWCIYFLQISILSFLYFSKVKEEP
ncbi:hypothetical protein [Enterococcus sp. DIV0086]|uniref:hypothetical protein n=1 Tax=Enterococcus sp. DIV0086 TaxID=2774655 RepID=UPI003D2E3F90